MKKSLSIIVTLLLVVAFATTGVFAASGDIISFSDEASFVHMPVLGKAINTVTTQDVLDYGTEFKTNYYLLTCYAEPYASTTFAQGAYGCFYMNGNDVWFAIMLSAPSTPSIASMNTIFNTISQQSYTTAKYSNNSLPTNQVFTYKASAAQNDLYSALGAFDTWDDALNTFDQFVSAGYPTSVSEVFDFSLSPGYALVIDGACEISEHSFRINNSWDFTPNGNLRVNGSFEKVLSSTYIRDGYSPDLALSRDDLIQWEALNPNIFGTASMYEAYSTQLVTVLDGQTYVIGYPTLYGFGTSNSRLLYTNSVDLVGSLYLSYNQRPTFRYVAIESLSEFTNTGNFYTYSVFRPEVADVEGDVGSGSGGSVISPSTPLPSGGGNANQPPVDEDSSLLGTISRFVNDIKRLLSSAVEAINTLVSQGGQFMQSIGAMFTWLPEPLLTVIIGAFTVLLVVGVLKVLWR